MGRRAALFTEADLKRAAKVAEERGKDWAVRVLTDGSIELYRKAVEEPARSTPPRLRAVL